jgi:hypothetical protein
VAEATPGVPVDAAPHAILPIGHLGLHLEQAADLHLGLLSCTSLLTLTTMRG